MSRIRYQDVASSNIRALAFDKDVGYVEFGSGRRFAYSMNKKMFDELAGAKSIGTYFARNVKGKCPVVWNGYCCDNSPCKNDATKIGHPGDDAQAGLFHVCDACASVPRFQGITLKPIPESKT